MRIVALVASVVIATSASVSPAFAHGDGDSIMAFSSAPLSNADLDSAHGNGLSYLTLGSARQAHDQYAVNLLQTIGQTSRIGFDNWFAQPGAALIDNNLLAAR